MKIRVFITDDHAMVRRGLRQIFEEAEDIVVVGEAEDYGGLVAGLKHTPCDVLLIDVSMPGRNGIDALKQVLKDHPRLKALVVSMYAEDQFALRALKAGASGYLTKTSGPDKLVEAVRQVARGRRYVTPAVAEALVQSVTRDDGRPAHETLSDREFQTLRMIAAGKKLSQIALEMSLSAKTVSVYRSRLLQKMGLKNNGELTRYALEHRLVD